MIRVILFCDDCNQQGIRYIEQKRNSDRGDRGGRRVTDGRAWHEGSFAEAEKLGWVNVGDQHFCPRCQQRKQ